MSREPSEPSGEGQGLLARVRATLDRLGAGDRAALAVIVERDRSFGERAARKEPR